MVAPPVTQTPADTDPADTGPADTAVADHLLRVIARLNRWANRHADLGLPVAQARVLSLVEELEPARVTTLAQADNCSQPAMTGHLKRLELAGLTRRTPDCDDARASLVTVTAAGHTALAALRRRRAESLHAALTALGPNDPGHARIAAATRALEDLLDAARASTPIGKDS